MSSIFDSLAECLVNPVNCVGVMGKGLALQFKKKYPTYYQHYHASCMAGGFKPGMILAYWEWSDPNPNYPEDRARLLISFPTKFHWAQPSQLSYIEDGLSHLVAKLTACELSTVAIPRLGCGLGGLNWEDVKPLIVKAFENTSITVEYFE